MFLMNIFNGSSDDYKLFLQVSVFLPQMSFTFKIYRIDKWLFLGNLFRQTI